jgi:hypothetical protein
MLQQFHNIGRNRPQAASGAYRHYCRARQRDGRARIRFRDEQTKMDRVLEWWSAYHGWAINLDSEGRFYIIASSLLLVGIYTLINSSDANRSRESSDATKTNRTSGNDRPR